jgi:hypothetical protein
MMDHDDVVNALCLQIFDVGTIECMKQVRSELIEALGLNSHEEFSPADFTVAFEWYYPRRFREPMWMQIKINILMGTPTALYVAGHFIQHAHKMAPLAKEVLDRHGIINLL